jgi:hypothetical protein
MGIFLFMTMSRRLWGPSSLQPPIQWVPGALFLAVKRPRLEADHSPPSSAEVKNAWSYTSTPPISLHGVVLSNTSTYTLFIAGISNVVPLWILQAEKVEGLPK